MNELKQGKLSIAFVCMVLGFMLTIQVRATLEQRTTFSYQRIEDLATRLLQTEKERDQLKEEVTRLEKAEAPLSKSEAYNDMQMKAGMVAVSGPGIIVTIDDSRVAAKTGENPNLYLIHDDDLLRVVNELRAAGAEAISINGQRLIATSEIRCAGPTLSVNNVRSAPPYEISVIGDSKNLVNALNMRGGVVETLKVWGIMLDIKKVDEIIVPAYKGSFQFKYGRAVEQEGA